MTEKTSNTIREALNIVDEGLRTSDYAGMAQRITRLFSTDPNNLYEQVKERYPENKYRGGHMQNAYGTPTAAAQRARQNVEQAQRARQDAARAQYGQRNPEAQTAQKTNTASNAADSRYFTEHSETPGLLMKVFGFIGAGLFGLWTLINLIWHLMLRATFFSGATGASVGITLVITILFLVMALAGHLKQKKAKRFRKYREVLGKKLYASLDRLAEAVKGENSAVAKELVQMSRDNWFREGHLDDANTTFMATDELYEQYQSSLESAKERAAAEERENAGIPAEVREILRKGNQYVAKIQEANDAIEDREISDKLDRMKQIVEKIFAEVKEQPSVARNLNMFMDYYLPTTEKLMNAYIELDAQPIQGENISSAKKEIVSSLDVINDAYEKLLDSFFKDQAMDVSTDISVMKTMMRQQGLTPTELEQMQQKQGGMAYASGGMAYAEQKEVR